MTDKLNALLGEKVYHSIGHLPGSKTGPGDWTIDEGSAAHLTDPSKWAGPREWIVVQEKMDGTCVSVVRQGGQIIPALRSGHRAETSPYEQHHRFARWVYDNYDAFSNLLNDGERVCGEWMAQAHGIIYSRLPSLFFAFDIRSGGEWLPTLEVMRRCHQAGLETVPLLYLGPPLQLEQIRRLTNRSAFRNKGHAEGAVIRREVGGRRADIAKLVRQDFEPGRYLPGLASSAATEPTWHKIIV